MEEQYKKQFVSEVIFLAVIGLIVYIFCRFLLLYLLPFVLAAILVYLLGCPARKISEHLRLRPEKIAAILLITLYFLFLILLFFSYKGLIALSRNILSAFPDFIIGLEEVLIGIKKNVMPLFGTNSPQLTQYFDELSASLVEDIKSVLYAKIPSFLGDALSKTPSFLFSILVTVVASFYIAKDYNRLIKFFKGIIGERIYKNALRVKEIFTGSVLRLIRGYLILSGITFAELLLILFALRVKYFFIISLLISFIDLLPVLGAGIILIPWGIISILTGDTKMGLLILAAYIVIVITRNILEPKIIGKETGINPLFILASIFAGLKLMGGLGLVLFPIVLIVIIKYYENWVLKEKE